MLASENVGVRYDEITGSRYEAAKLGTALAEKMLAGVDA